MRDDIDLARALYALLPRLGRMAARSAHEAGTLSVARLKALGILARTAPVRAGEFAEGCYLTPAAATHAVDALVGEGLARREADPADRRVVLLHLTPKGRRELAHAEQLALSALARAIEGLDPQTRAQLRDALPKLERVLAARESSTIPSSLLHTQARGSSATLPGHHDN